MMEFDAPGSPLCDRRKVVQELDSDTKSGFGVACPVFTPVCF